jgi:membrane protease YdiL (CAAX protease family)
MNAYLDLARQGRTKWWHFLLAIVIILVFWQLIGALPSVILLIWIMADGNPNIAVSSSGQFLGIDPSIGFSMTMLASVFFMVGIFLAIRFIHQRPFQTLISPAPRIAWSRFFQGFSAWFILSGLMSLLEAVFYPGRYIWTFNSHQFIPFVVLAIIFIPIQTSAEELFFRSYILQGFGLRLRNIWILSFISGFLFMIPHLLNPEAQLNYPLMGFYFFLIGAVLAYLTLKDGRLELALGLHAANNLFSALFANYTVTVMPSPSLFTIQTLDTGYSVLAAVIGLLIFILVFFRPSWIRSPISNKIN